MTDQIKPCPFCGGTGVEIEGKGQLWRGVKGYSDPQYFTLRHHGSLNTGDEFDSCHVYFRARKEEDLIKYWNTRMEDRVRKMQEEGE